MQNNILGGYDSFYFLGIGGVSMSALAKILCAFGKRVGGYDREAGDYTRELISRGIAVNIGAANMCGYDAVVYTDALGAGCAQLEEAAALSIPCIPRGRLLAAVAEEFKKTLAVAGCHGKTTCTAMLAHIFSACGCKFCAHIGGKDANFGNFTLTGNDVFLTEACEYNRNFLYLKPFLSVILNTDADHLDCYGNAEEVKKAYLDFAANSSKTVKLYGDLPEVDGVTFGFDDRADYYAKSIKGRGGKFSFAVYGYGVRLGEISLNIYGKHNVLNALAAIAAARELGLGFEGIAHGLGGFCGVERRFEFIGRINGAQCIADYAHHPNEIKASLKTAKQITEGRLFVVFQPHTYSRTKALFKQFVRVLAQQKNLLLYKTFAAREYYDDAGSAYTLSRALKNSRYAEGERDITFFLRGATEGDAVLFLGAGDIYGIAKKMADG